MPVSLDHIQRYKKFNSYELNFQTYPIFRVCPNLFYQCFSKHTNNINYMIFHSMKNHYEKFIYELFIELSYMKVHKSTYIQVLQDIINSLFCLWKNKNLVYHESLYDRLSRNISSQMKYFLYLQMKSRDTAFYKVKCVIIIYQFLVKGIINSNNISPYLQGLIECSCNEHSYKFQV